MLTFPLINDIVVIFKELLNQFSLAAKQLLNKALI